MKRRRRAFVLAVILPVLAYYGLLYWYPVVRTFISSFTDWNLAAPSVSFIGAENFVKMFRDPTMIRVLLNTLRLVLYVVPLQIILSFLVAVMLDSLSKGARNALMLPYFLPSITSMVVTGLVWRWLLHPNAGLVNFLIGLVGIPPSTWLSNPSTVMQGVSLVLIWRSIGFYAILFLTGLQNIPQMFYEAAVLDGASIFQRVRHVTLPMLAQTSVFVVAIAIIAGMTTFTLIYMLWPGYNMGGGPAGAANVMSFYIYQQAIRYNEMGYASAVAILLFLILLGVTYLQMRLSRSSWEY